MERWKFKKNNNVKIGKNWKLIILFGKIVPIEYLNN